MELLPENSLLSGGVVLRRGKFFHAFSLCLSSSYAAIITLSPIRMEIS